MNEETKPEKSPCCDDWIAGVTLIGQGLFMDKMHGGLAHAHLKPFHYCPWCGKPLEK